MPTFCCINVCERAKRMTLGVVFLLVVFSFSSSSQRLLLTFSHPRRFDVVRPLFLVSSLTKREAKLVRYVSTLILDLVCLTLSVGCVHWFSCTMDQKLLSIAMCGIYPCTLFHLICAVSYRSSRMWSCPLFIIKGPQAKTFRLYAIFE